MKQACIFGATGGIGQGIAYQLAAAGWSLWLHYDHQKSVASSLCQQLQIDYPDQTFEIIKLDFTKPGDLQWLANLGAVQALIFAQGVTDYHLLPEVSASKLDQITAVNVLTPIKIIQVLQHRLLQHEHSRIVLLGSIYGAVGSAMEVMYSTTKGALSSFANAYAREVAANGLTVNVIAPGAVATNMLTQFTAAELSELAQDIPVGKLAQAQDIAYWVEVLLTPSSQYMTGQTLYVDGGWLK